MITTKLNNTAPPSLNSGGPDSNYLLKFCLSLVLRIYVWVSQNVCKIIFFFLEFQVIAVVDVNYSLLWV